MEMKRIITWRPEFLVALSAPKQIHKLSHSSQCRRSWHAPRVLDELTRTVDTPGLKAHGQQLSFIT